MKSKIILFILVLAACSPTKQAVETQSNHFPAAQEKATVIPPKENFYIFLMAGQSNMAGRGFVQPDDTVSNPRVLTLNKDNEWVYAKEPLHYYEPGRTGLDCGLSFGKKLAKLYGKDITIGLVPCAVGGSSIEQWLGDSTYRNVKLYSNFMKKATIAKQSGTIKGMLWHQGESNANAASYKYYKRKLENFFVKVRTDLGDTDMPVYTGQLAGFLSRTTNPFADAINMDLEILSENLPNVYVIHTLDLLPKEDSIHFDSPSQRKMGERFATRAYQSTK